MFKPDYIAVFIVLGVIVAAGVYISVIDYVFRPHGAMFRSVGRFIRRPLSAIWDWLQIVHNQSMTTEVPDTWAPDDMDDDLVSRDDTPQLPDEAAEPPHFKVLMEGIIKASSDLFKITGALIDENADLAARVKRLEYIIKARAKTQRVANQVNKRKIMRRRAK